MKVGTITKSNSKGQIVIPKDIRDTLGINDSVFLNIVARGRGVYIYPIEDVSLVSDRSDSYVRILKKTQGAWGKSSAAEIARVQSCRKKELAASQKRKAQW